MSYPMFLSVNKSYDKQMKIWVTNIRLNNFFKLLDTCFDQTYLTGSKVCILFD